MELNKDLSAQLHLIAEADENTASLQLHTAVIYYVALRSLPNSERDRIMGTLEKRLDEIKL